MSFIARTLLKTFNNAPKLITRNLASGPAQVQFPAPDFKGQAVVDGDFKEIQLSDFKGKYLVLFFYPLDFTFVCPTEITAFSDRINEFKELNTEVVGVSTDSHFSHLAWINLSRKEGGLGGLKYPLLSDFQKTISKDYNVLIDGAGIALRGTFIIDPSGVLRQMSVNDLPVGRSVDEYLRLVKAFQFVEKHGEVCPANWQPGDKTIVPNQVDKLDFFQTKYSQEKDKEVKSEPIDPNAFRVQVNKEGDGKSVPNGSKITVHYTGYLKDGSVFDSSVSRKKPFTFTLGQQQVIKCWDIGFKQLSVGAKAVLTCPSDYAYGDRGFAQLIPPKATLTFEVEVISYK